MGEWDVVEKDIDITKPKLGTVEKPGRKEVSTGWEVVKDMPSGPTSAGGMGQTLFEMVGRPVIEGVGLVGGGLVGSASGPLGTVAGAGLGYGIGKKAADIIERPPQYLGARKELEALPRELASSAKDVATGAMMEMGGQAVGAAIPKVAGAVGTAGKQALGRLTGTGKEAIEQAYRSSPAFKEFMRGKLGAEDVVKVAREALGSIKDARAAEYQAALESITASGRLPAVPGSAGGAGGINPKPIVDKLKKLMFQYNIKGQMTPDGPVILDTSRVAMGKKGMKDIEETIQLIGQWGRQPEDFSAKGLDTLKRQLDDFYSDSSQARQFVASIRKTVRDTIAKAVPEYGKMTKKYADATQLIKDIESNLMMRKQGMSGRIVSDQTLRRLMSAMRDNFELRKDLVGMLSAEGGKDVMGAIGGHSLSHWMPHGIAGAGPALVGSSLSMFVSPKFLPVVAMSSPRVAGEFVSMLSKYSGKMAGIGEAAGRAMIYQGGKQQETIRGK